MHRQPLFAALARGFLPGVRYLIAAMVGIAAHEERGKSTGAAPGDETVTLDLEFKSTDGLTPLLTALVCCS